MSFLINQRFGRSYPMKDFPRLYEYLESNNVEETTSDVARQAVIDAYYKAYHREYEKRKKEHVKRLTLRLTKAEWREVEKGRKGFAYKSMNAFIVAGILSIVRDTYLQKSPRQIEALTIAINRIGVLINQVVAQLHLRRSYSRAEAYKELAQHIEAVEETVESFLKSPIENPDMVAEKAPYTPQLIAEILRAFIELNPQEYDHLVDFLKSLKP